MRMCISLSEKINKKKSSIFFGCILFAFDLIYFALSAAQGFDTLLFVLFMALCCARSRHIPIQVPMAAVHKIYSSSGPISISRKSCSGSESKRKLGVENSANKKIFRPIMKFEFVFIP